MIYLDHHATTPLHPRVRDALADALTSAVAGNPSSVHAAGRAARAALEQARARVAAAVGASSRELVFTSGGTEALHRSVRSIGDGCEARAVFVDPGAHPALRAACASLASRRGVALIPIPIEVGGPVRADALVRALSAQPVPAVVGLSWVQHETGSVADVRSVIHAARASGAHVVLDAVQALGKVPVDLGSTGAAAAALSAHKIGGLSGTGAIWFAPDARVVADDGGGSQERGLRAGTENVLGSIAFGAAATTLEARLACMPRLAALRDRVEATLRAIDGVVINGSTAARVATALHASLRGIAGEELVAALDLEGYCVSAGPACSSGRPGASTSMLALYPDEPWRARSALRITLGPETDAEDIAGLCDRLPEVIARMRRAE